MTVEEIIKREHDEVERLEDHQRELMAGLEDVNLGADKAAVLRGLEQSHAMLRTAKNTLFVLGQSISKGTKTHWVGYEIGQKVDDNTCQ